MALYKFITVLDNAPKWKYVGQRAKCEFSILLTCLSNFQTKDNFERLLRVAIFQILFSISKYPLKISTWDKISSELQEMVIGRHHF